jgi:hypothetical protein
MEEASLRGGVQTRVHRSHGERYRYAHVVPVFDIGLAALFAGVFVVLWPLSVWWFVRIERRRPPTVPTGDGDVRAECVHCEGLGAIPSRTGPQLCSACGGTGVTG